MSFSPDEDDSKINGIKITLCDHIFLLSIFQGEDLVSNFSQKPSVPVS